MCVDGSVTVKDGWRLNTTRAAPASNRSQDGRARYLFRCPEDGLCPQQLLSDEAAAGCGGGRVGPLCARCARVERPYFNRVAHRTTRL